MKRHTSLFSYVMVAALMLTVFVGPASADNNYTGTLSGTASVGKWFGTGDKNCTKDTADTATPHGEGLYFVGTPGDQARARHGTFQISTDVMILNDKGGLPFPGVLHVCGWLDREAPFEWPGQPERNNGLGAACGASKGFGGRGWVEDATGQKLVKLSDLGWKASGSTFVVNGNYEEYDPVTKKKNNKVGAVKAVIQASGGGLSCSEVISPNGAQLFNVNGTFDLLNGVGGGDKTPNNPTGDGSDEFKKGTSPDNTKECKTKDDSESKTKPAGMDWGPQYCPPSERDKPNS